MAFYVFSAYSKDVMYNVTYKIEIGENTPKVQFVCMVPKNIRNVQSVLSMNYLRKPYREYQQNGNKFAEFIIENEKGLIHIGYTTELEIKTHDLKTVMIGRNVDIDKPEKYLMSEKYIEKDDPRICSIARSLKNRNTLKTIRNIYHYVNKNLKYNGFNPVRKGAVNVLDKYMGDCSEFADLFVALCRSCNIPSMSVFGYYLNFSVTPKHAWAEVYTDLYGWIRFDPTPGGRHSFFSLPNQYIHYSTGKGDENNRIYFYRYLYWGDPINVTEEIRFR